MAQSDSSGDWVINDQYELDGNGKIAQLKRVIKFFPEDESEEQEFRWESGRFVKAGSVLRDLHSQDLMSPQHPIFEVSPLPVFVEKAEFPFAQLVNKAKEIWSTGKSCSP